ncbi:MAG: 2-phospho-L-lactate guanylyltransferase [Oceanospirillaceae bacterium]|nr:2-phospho-L-lactate guanylyltransferase [Oceanospirillaceae bacterium]
MSRTINMNRDMSLCILIPMKSPQQSKQRLAPVLAPQERQSLALNLFHNTLKFLQQHFSHISVLVVTPCADIAKIARQYHAQVVLETAATGLNSAIRCGTQGCIEQGFAAQLLIPADIIDLDVDEFKQLINRPRAARSVTVCPSRDGGTNALLSSPPDIIDFQFGANSSRRHLESARQLQLEWRELKLDKLALDLDTAADLVLLDDAFVSQLVQPHLSTGEHMRGMMR